MVEDVRVAADSPAQAAREHASSLLPCPKDQLKLRQLHLGHEGRALPAFFVDGCTQRLVYTVVASEDYAVTTDTPKGALVLISRFTLGPTPR
jgi:hypothetical protein